MLTNEQTQRLLCMQMLTVEAGNSIPNEEVYAVWAWAENILEARRRLAAKEVPPGAWSRRTHATTSIWDEPSPPVPGVRSGSARRTCTRRQ